MQLCVSCLDGCRYKYFRYPQVASKCSRSLYIYPSESITKPKDHHRILRPSEFDCDLRSFCVLPVRALVVLVSMVSIISLVLY